MSGMVSAEALFKAAMKVHERGEHSDTSLAPECSGLDISEDHLRGFARAFAELADAPCPHFDSGLVIGVLTGLQVVKDMGGTE